MADSEAGAVNCPICLDALHECDVEVFPQSRLPPRLCSRVDQAQAHLSRMPRPKPGGGPRPGGGASGDRVDSRGAIGNQTDRPIHCRRRWPGTRAPRYQGSQIQAGFSDTRSVSPVCTLCPCVHTRVKKRGRVFLLCHDTRVVS